MLNDRQRPLPIGVPGRLHISGASLARGILRKPQQTAECFIANPFFDPLGDPPAFSRMVDTGILALWRPDGSLEFAGFANRQVHVACKASGVQYADSDLLPFLMEVALLLQCSYVLAIALICCVVLPSTSTFMPQHPNSRGGQFSPSQVARLCEYQIIWHVGRIFSGIISAAILTLQVLLRGSRIVLSDVEAVLESAPGVEQAVALVQDDPTGAQRLVAYVTPASLDGAQVLAQLRGKLPAHLMPASVTALPQVSFEMWVLTATEKRRTHVMEPHHHCSHDLALSMAPPG